ncbi:MAG: hypothetical protein R2819_14560 [Allomuricauda sp.]
MRFKLVYILVLTVGLQGSLYGQLNDYKYIIVPKRFDAFKTENKHQTSTMVKHLLTEKGFTAVYDDELPEDLANNRCLGLTASLLDNSSLFSTKTVIVLKNCQNSEVFRTVEGRSKIKEYRAAYMEALEGAFVSFDGMGYAYKPKEKAKEEPADEKPVTISFKDDVKSLEKKPDPKVVEQVASQETQIYKSKEPVPSNMVKVERVEEPKELLEEEKPKTGEPMTADLLYAQPIENGYQLVDSTPKVVLRLEETSVENVFLVNYEGKSGVVFKKEGQWFLEYSENGEKQIHELKIKF